MTVSEHIGWLKIYVEGMTPDNWVDMRLRCERQLNELTVALSDQADGWRTDFDNAPSPCLGWCQPPSGDAVRVIYRQFWRNIPHWSSHGSEITVKAWQPLPSIDPAPPPSSTAGEG